MSIRRPSRCPVTSTRRHVASRWCLPGPRRPRWVSTPRVRRESGSVRVTGIVRAATVRAASHPPPAQRRACGIGRGGGVSSRSRRRAGGRRGMRGENGAATGRPRGGLLRWGGAGPRRSRGRGGRRVRRRNSCRGSPPGRRTGPPRSSRSRRPAPSGDRSR